LGVLLLVGGEFGPVELFPVCGGGVAGFLPYGEAFCVELCGRAGQKVRVGESEEGGVVGRAGRIAVS